MPLHEQTRQVASPVAANPSQALFQILGTVLESCLNLGCFVVLHGNLPAVCVHPSGDEIVVVGIELVGSPCLVGEAKSERFILQDLCTVGYGSSRKTGQSSVNMKTCGAVKVASLEIEGAQETPQGGLCWSHEALRCSNSAHFLVLERCKHPLKDCSRPDYIVVGKYCDLCRDLRDCLAHLPALVGLFNTQNSNFFAVNIRRHLPSPLEAGIESDDYDLVGLGGQASFDCPAKFLTIAIDGGNNDSNILRCVGRILGDGNWLEGPMGY